MSFFQDLHDKRAIEALRDRRREPFRSSELKPLPPTIGAEIRGIDPSRPVYGLQA